MAKTDIEATDQRIKWGLLIASILTLLLLIASALRENVFDPWRLYRADYRKILDEMATTDRERTIADQFEIGIDQNVLPEFGVIDRCITCHTGLDDPRMVNQEHPFRTHPGALIANHPPELFGCTVCHQGQGRATDRDEAHGRVLYWSYPMFDVQFMYSACGKCHDQQMLYGEDGLLTRGAKDGTQRGAVLMVQGKQFLEDKGCLGCHTFNGRGGILGPDITFVGDKTRHDLDFSHFDKDEPREVVYWLKTHFLDPTRISPDSVMPDLKMTEEEADALTAYVLSLRRPQAPGLYSGQVAKERIEPPPATGEEIFKLMCAACHGPEGKGSEVPSIRTPSLNNVDSLAVASDDYYRFIIANGRPDSPMPAWGPESENMTYDEIDRVVAHIRNWEPKGADATEVSVELGDAKMGRVYFQGLCANCHGRRGEGGIGTTLNSPTFLSIVSDRFLTETIIKGRPGTAMASWKHLPAQAVSDLLAYLRSWQAEPPSFDDVKACLDEGTLEENVRVGAALFSGNCATCHGPQGEGGIGVRLNGPDILPAMDDRYLYLSITEGRPTTAMPAWRHLSADNVAALMAFLRSWNDGGPLVLEATLVLEAPRFRGDYTLGEVLYNVACVGCHGQQGRGGVGPQLANPNFLHSAPDAVLYRWIAHGRTGTAMRGFLSSEQGPVSLMPWQIADVIAYLRYRGSRAHRPILRTGVGNPFLGGQLFEGTCSGCHGKDGEGASGPQLNNPAFLAAASDGFLAGTIVLGRQGTPMRSMVHGQEGLGQIAPEQVQDVIAYMRLWDYEDKWRKPRAIAEMSERAINSGREKFSQYCAGCHGTNGLGTQEDPSYVAPSLNNRQFLAAASDGFLLATIARGRSNTAMRPFGRGTGGIASLDAGAISDIVSYIRTWEEAYASQGD